MKKTILLCLFAVIGSTLHAQVHSLSENFDISCVTTPGTIFSPSGWSEYTTIGLPGLSWACAPLNGRNGTPGMECSNLSASSYYLDTSWLFSPEINLNQYQDSAYLWFDTKYTQFVAKLSIRLYFQYSGGYPDSTGIDSFIDVTSLVQSSDTGAVIHIDNSVHLADEPYVGDPDSSQWVTRQLNLTPYKGNNMYIAFLYTSTNGSEGTWDLDNILTTATSLNVQSINNTAIPLTVLGNSTSNRVRFSYTLKEAGIYGIAIYDIMGRTVYKENITARSGTNTYTINGLNLSNGMYLVKMGNEKEYGVAKTIVED